MSEITKEEVLGWMGSASTADLTEIADELIERDFACSPQDLTDLEHELSRRDEEDEVEPDLIGEARDRLRRREYREALHVLAIALGRDFDALETIPLEAA